MKNNTPAMLFYHEDWIAGTGDMTMEERGQYITLLAYQNSHGHMSKEYIDRICPGCSEYVLNRFSTDDDGLYYNRRAEMEIEKRNNYSSSRSKNRKKETYEEHMKNTSSSYEKHMETETHIYNNSSLGDRGSGGKRTVPATTAKEIIDHLNARAGTTYRANSRKTLEKIRARMNEGFTLDDFIRVIDVKAEEWLGTDMEKFLRPETLFGTKFEGYVNQKPAKKSTGNPFLDMLMEGEQA